MWSIFEILDRIGPIAYMLAFPASMNVHNVFHVSLLKKCVHDPNIVIDWHMIQVETEKRLSGTTSANIGQKSQNALESSYRDGKISVDLLRS